MIKLVFFRDMRVGKNTYIRQVCELSECAQSEAKKLVGKANFADEITLIGYVRQKSDLTGSLYCLGKLALMHCAGTGSAAGQNLAALGDIAAELCNIFIVDVGSLIYAKLANFSTFAVLGIVLIKSQSCILLS